MISPAAVPLTEEEFRNISMQLFPDADEETLSRLYPMVNDLRALAALVSERMLTDVLLSETATGE